MSLRTKSNRVSQGGYPLEPAGGESYTYHHHLKELIMYCKIALLSPPFSELTYAIPPYISEEYVHRGMRVAIPLGNGALRVGIVLEKLAEHGLSADVQIRNFVWILEKEALINEELLDLVGNLSVRQVQAKAQILANLLPQPLRTTTKLRLKEYCEGERPKIHAFKNLKNYADEDISALFQKYCTGNSVELIELADDSALNELCRLTQDPPWNIRPNAKKQKEVLEFIYENQTVTRKRLQTNFGNTVLATLDSLVKAALIDIVPSNDEEDSEESTIIALLEETLEDSSPIFDYSEEQRNALAHGKEVLQAKQAQLRLLYGITGSGKTAVYMELARQCLQNGRSVFFLAPEVALALKLRKDAEKFLPQAKIHFSHGYQSPQKRAKTYKEIASDENPFILVGTRSALFHAIKQNIGLIVLDEEHDSSYKQDEKFYYHAKEIAWYRAQKHNALMIIGSATPDIKTYYSVQQQKMACDTMHSRVGGGALPQIELVDISAMPKSGTLSSTSLEALKTCLENDEQAVILLNRRGYAPVMYCLDCKEVQKCPHCSIALTYHKKREVLTCHYCNYSNPFPSPCANCKGMQFLPLGTGTEKIEEQLSSFLQENGLDKKILRLDRDSTRRHGSMEEILAKFSRKEASILVGTQMLSKGHHFPHVSLAIIADGDLSLNFPDYRAAERTFQLLVQSAGRAGRELENGRVIIQSRDTKHYCWQYIQHHDYNSFYEYEIALRQKRQYPPFVNLAMIRISIPMGKENFSEALSLLAQQLKSNAKNYDVKLLGPVSSPLAIIQNVRRYQCLLKAKDWKNIRALFYAAQVFKQEQNILKDIKITLDIDPVNML